MGKYFVISLFINLISFDSLAITVERSDEYYKKIQDKFQNYLKESNQTYDPAKGAVVPKESIKAPTPSAKIPSNKMSDPKKTPLMTGESNDSFIIIGPNESIEPYLPERLKEKETPLSDKSSKAIISRQTASKEYKEMNKNYPKPANKKEYWQNYYRDKSIQIKKNYSEDSNFIYFYE